MKNIFKLFIRLSLFQCQNTQTLENGAKWVDGRTNRQFCSCFRSLSVSLSLSCFSTHSLRFIVEFSSKQKSKKKNSKPESSKRDMFCFFAIISSAKKATTTNQMSSKMPTMTTNRPEASPVNGQLLFLFVFSYYSTIRNGATKVKRAKFTIEEREKKDELKANRTKANRESQCTEFKRKPDAYGKRKTLKKQVARLEFDLATNGVCSSSIAANNANAERKRNSETNERRV